MEYLNQGQKVRIRNESNTAWEAEPWFVFAHGNTVAVYQTMDTPIRYMHRDEVTPWKEMCVQCETYLQTVGVLCQECAKQNDARAKAGHAAVPANGVVCKRCRAPTREHANGVCMYCGVNEPLAVPAAKVYPYADQDQQWSTPQDES